MATNLVVVKEDKKEARVAASPETVKKLIDLGCKVTVQKAAGLAAGFSDEAYKQAGAVLTASLTTALKNADIVLAVNAPKAATLKNAKAGTIVAAIFAPQKNAANVNAYLKAKLRPMAMELMPRITRAQSMDVLSSQSNLAGYKAVLDGVAEYNRALPMMMTAAGTVPAARVFVMGAGVAGLQAIATARRLGAIVSATDVRAAAAEQVESLGASFVMVEADAGDSGETEGGYAKEMSDDYKKRQQALVADHITKQDIVICTALIPGKPAPELVSKAMVESMKAGSVVVDLAVEQGGNCPLSKAGKIVEHKGVKIVAHENVPGRLAGNASELYARNLLNFITAFWDEEQQQPHFDEADEIIQAIALRAGKEPEKKSAVKNTPVIKKPTAKKPTGKKPVAKKPVAKKPATKSLAAKKPVAKKTGAKTTTKRVAKPKPRAAKK